MAIASGMDKEEAGTRGTLRASRCTSSVLLAMLAFTSGWQIAVAAQDTVFTVANYPVEARADNALAAKTKALAEGQQAALRSLLKRLVPVTQYQRLRRLPSIKASDLVEGVSVRAERNSSTDYIASLDFSFQAAAVRDLLRREGIPYMEEQASTLTLIPLWRGAAGEAARGQAAWTNVWKGLDLEHALTPVKLDALKKEVAPSVVTALAGGDGGAIRSLVAAYGSEPAIVAIAERDVAANRLNVTLAGRDAVGAFVLRRAYRVDPSDPGYSSELAAVVSLGIIEGRWKAVKSGGGAGPEPVAAAARDSALQIAVQFRGMSEWQEISSRLSGVPGVEDLDVAGLSARGARVTLRYPEGAEGLADALAQQGLSLRNVDGMWVLSLP